MGETDEENENPAQENNDPTPASSPDTKSSTSGGEETPNDASTSNSVTSSTGDSESNKDDNNMSIVYGVIGGALVALIAGIVFFVSRNRSKDQIGARKMVDNDSDSNGLELSTNPMKDCKGSARKSKVE